MRLDPATMARLAECPDPAAFDLAPEPRPGRIRGALSFLAGVALTLLVMLLASKAMPQAALDLVRAGL